jgi:YegS/Rv2252/BmrU family lipid kinase
MKTLAVINPRSAGGRTGRDAEQIARRLAEISGPLTVALTSGPLDAARITTRALLEGFERIVAVGGDGTINEVVNGFFHEGEVINPEAELSLLNMGTGGDFRKTFEMGAGLEPSLQRIAEGVARRIDVGCLSFVTPEGQSGKRYFANIASFGLSGEVVDRVNRARLLKRMTGQFAYTWGSLSALMSFRPRPVRLKVDDVFDEVIEISTCAVCNGQFFGGGMRVAPDATPDDGLFDVIIMRAAPLRQTLASMNDIYTGAHVNNPNVRVVRGRSVIATPVAATQGAPVHIEADGESPGRLPAMFEVLPRAITFRG